MAIERVGICGTDIHAFHGRHPFIRYPLVPGHELAGTVQEVPDDAQGLAAGDRVSIDPYRTCGSCRPCRIGKSNCCQSMHVLGVHGNGGLQSLLAVEPRYLHRSRKLSTDQLALVEPASIGAHAVQRSGLRDDETVLIVGAGPIGLAALQFALFESGKVAVSELNPLRRQWVNDHFDVEILEGADDRVHDVVIDATGNPKAMEQSFHRVAHGGRLVFVGIIDARISFDDGLFHGRELTVLASRNSHDDFPRIIELIECEKFDPTGWVTHRVPFQEVPPRFEQLIGDPKLIKGMIEMPA